MKMLVISDLHVGKVDQHQENAFRELTEAIQKAIGDHHIDVLLIAGDISYSGKRAEYDKFEKTVLLPLLRKPGFSKTKVIAVPGNHDMDCDHEYPLDWGTLDTKVRHVFFQNTEDGRKMRARRKALFHEYSSFIERNNIQSVDPQYDISKLVRYDFNGLDVAFVTLNTAYFSHSQYKNDGQIPSPLPALRGELPNAENAAHLIVVGHHPPESFEEESREKFRSWFYEKRALYIHGHTHKVHAESSKHGLRRLGFGAGYQATLDAKRDSLYVNMFALCELERELHIEMHQWDSQNGRWTPYHTLPAEFDKRSDRLRDGYVCPLPQYTQREMVQLVNDKIARHDTPTIELLIGLGVPNEEIWLGLLRRMSVVDEKDNIAPITGALLAYGLTEFEASSAKGRHLIRCNWAPSHVLSKGEIERAYTLMDSEDYVALTYVLLGTIDDDARTLLLRLGRKKSSFKVLENREIVKLIQQEIPGRISDLVECQNAGEVGIDYLLLPHGIGLLIVEKLRGEWFCVVGEDANILDESDSIVLSCRERVPSLMRANYRRLNTPHSFHEDGSAAIEAFDRSSYLKMGYDEFNAVRYAPLAAVGIRLSNAKLDELYIPANAELGTEGEMADTLRQMINDLLDSLSLNEDQRSQLEAQIRQRFGPMARSETGAARQFYQQYQNVLVLGDPGSGKTCFVQNEILAYCKPPTGHGASSWYGSHTPIYVSLAEAARLLSSESDLVAICSTLAMRRGLRLSSIQLQELLAKGEVAFFFDGLDEVVSIDHRVQLMEMITRLMNTAAPIGCRFVLSSRPAAVQLVDIPDELKVLQLKGLSEGEIRTLATYIFARVSADGKASIDPKVLSDSMSDSLIERLLEDCRANPGIFRIARNPLLLTLMVMIYAGSGPFAAKRHRIYANAVQTLVSVRNRESNQRVLSETDLRRRLGILALSLFRGGLGDVPALTDVIEVLVSTMKSEGKRGDLREEAYRFIQDVAESTGLIVINRRSDEEGGPTVSFMHYSFLEYYAAVGLNTAGLARELAALGKQNRWREVITLLAGIVSDQGDVTTLLSEIMQDDPSSDEAQSRHITEDFLPFAFECALECDVPPEASIRLLLTELGKSLHYGSSLIDSELRRKYGDQLGKLLSITGSNLIREFLADGISVRDARVCAAFIEITSYVGKEVDVGSLVERAFDLALSRRESVVRCAIYGAIDRVASLRVREGVGKVVKAGFSSSVTVLYAVIRATGANPGLAKNVWHELVAALDSKSFAVASAAAQALLEGGLPISPDDKRERLLLEKCLRLWEHSTRPGTPFSLKLRAKRVFLDEMLDSPDKSDRMLGLRLLPLLQGEERYVHRHIIEKLSAETEPDVIVAALSSLHMCKGAISLIVISEAESIYELLGSHQKGNRFDRKDIRIAAFRVLVLIKTQTDRLIEYCRSRSSLEFRECLRALITIGHQNERVKVFLWTELQTRLDSALTVGFGDTSDQTDMIRLMMSCEEAGDIAPTRLAILLEQVADDYKATYRIRGRAVRTYSRVVLPSDHAVTTLIRWLSQPNSEVGKEACIAVHEFIKGCSKNSVHLRAIFSSLPDIRTALIERWRLAGPRASSKVDDLNLRAIRGALVDIEKILIAYQEFSKRKKVETFLT